MARRDHPADESYEEDNIYEESDRRRRDREDRFYEPEPDSRHQRHRSSLVREIDERIRFRDRSRPEFPLPDPRPPLKDEVEDEGDFVRPRRREREYLDDLGPERETKEVYIRRKSSPSRDRHRYRRLSKDDVVFEEDDRGPRSRNDEDILIKKREEIRSRSNEAKRDEAIFHRRDRSLPPHRDRFDEVAFEDERRRRRAKSRDREEDQEYSDEEIEKEEKVIFGRHERSPQREGVIREDVKYRRRSLPPLDDDREELMFRRRDYSPRSRRRKDFSPQEEREEVLIRRRDRSPPQREIRERVLVRERDRSIPDRDEDREEGPSRRRNRSVPSRDEAGFRPRRRLSSSGKDDREEITIRHRERSASKERGEEDREEIRIRRRELSHSRRRPRSPEEEIDRDEIRVRRHHYPRPKNEDLQEEVAVRLRSGGIDEDDRDDIILRKSMRNRRGSPNPEGDRDEITIRDNPEGERVEIRRTHSPPPRARSQSRHRSDERDIEIRQSEREGRRGRREHERDIIIRKTKESSSSSESSPKPPSVIRKPPIIQEVITHHRHIESFERASPPRKHSPDTTKSQNGSVDEVEIEQRIERDGNSFEDDIVIEKRDISPHGRKSPTEERGSIITRSKPSDLHYNEVREIAIREVEREREMDSEASRDGRSHASFREKRDRRQTEITKDLVIREAIERAGYDYEESDRFYYIFDYLRFDDVQRLVDITEDILRSRRGRPRDGFRERDILSPLPVIPGPPPPPLAPRPPVVLEIEREAYRPRDVRYRERDVLVEGRRPRRYREI
ncbi:hypothetical protein BGW36DRAFT_104625 [Talaromyces proteolyticus]|uniref:DUF8035 domain-containing protein n=1 Tax=Talaromyces proteolyticus TaxID=1131652 RepID=A0AAD4Q3H6_9EURO|nr:uncharacterized protein BGW36DRAFT_104625 [Talaromyces proteolyticus]KAH8701752.1 hypothetical protein BGW36DRAFT_104625 [Talaromyces proteolyticus]